MQELGSEARSSTPHLPSVAEEAFTFGKTVLNTMSDALSGDFSKPEDVVSRLIVGNAGEGNAADAEGSAVEPTDAGGGVTGETTGKLVLRW